MNKSEIIGYNKAITRLVNSGILTSDHLVMFWSYNTSRQKQDEYFGVNE